MADDSFAVDPSNNPAPPIENPSTLVSEIPTDDIAPNQGSPEIPPVQQEIEKKSSALRIILIILAILLVLGAAAYFLWFRVTFVYEKSTLFSKTKHPELYLTLENRPIDPSLKPADFTVLKAQGLTFQVAKKGPALETDRANISSFAFGNGDRVVVSKSDSAYELKNTVSKDKNFAIFKKIVGEDKFASEYTTENTIINVTPNEIYFSQSKDKMVTDSLLLTLKEIISPVIAADEDHIYSFNTGQVKGFQFGSAKAGKTVVIRLFDKSDNRYEISPKANNQQEIDYMLNSIVVGQ